MIRRTLIAFGSLTIFGCELADMIAEPDFGADLYEYPRDKSIQEDLCFENYDYCKQKVELAHNHKYKRLHSQSKHDQYDYMLMSFRDCQKAKEIEVLRK